MKAKILVLGGTGNVGNPLIRTLLTDGVAVRVGGKRDSLRKLPRDGNVEPVEFDYNNVATYPFALTSIQRLFLLTPVLPTIVELTAKVMAEAKKVGVQRVVKVSALGTGASAKTTFGRWHYQSEEEVTKVGIPHIYLRPNGFMQNFANFSGHTIRTENAFYAPLGEGKVSYIDCRDVAAAAAVVLTSNKPLKEVYTLTGPKAISGHEAAEILTKELGRPIKYVPITAQVASETMLKMGTPEWFVRALLDLYASYRQGEGEAISTSVQDLTGRAPYTFEQYVRENKAAFSA